MDAVGSISVIRNFMGNAGRNACNDTFTTNKDLAQDSVMDACIGTKNRSFSPLLYRLHFCEDGSYGLGDYLGRKKVEH